MWYNRSRRGGDGVTYEVLDFRVENPKQLYHVLCPYCLFPNLIKTGKTDRQEPKVETEHVCQSCKEYFQLEVRYDLVLKPVKYDEPF